MYQTLYRKYRPKCFDDVIGQDVVVKTLKNSIKNDKVNHAYMFFGPRGVGKTSIAKIFARSINCINHDGNICNECESCIVSSNKECLDIIEIDAASNNGVDEIRELRDKVNLVPNQLKFKVYIIDEVHMLTIQAFNALLKTLEEPPAHAIFILATTDPQKVPETIVSRCQCFSFNRIADSDIVTNLNKICELEGIKTSDDVLNRIASFSNGGMRDSIGMLDKLYAYCDDEIKLADFFTLNRIVSNEQISELIHYMDESNVNGIIDLITKWNSDGINLVLLMDSVLEYLKNVITDKYVNKKFEYSNINKIIDFANLLNEKMFDIKRSSNPKIYIEIMILSFLNNNNFGKENISREIFSNKNEQKVTENNFKSEQNNDLKDNNNNEENLDYEINSSNNISNNSILNSNISEIINVRLNNVFLGADKAELLNDKKLFNDLNDYTFDQEIGYLVCALLDAEIRVSSKEYILLSYEYNSVVEENLEHLDDFSDVLNKILNLNKKVVIISNERWDIEKNNYIKNLKNNIKYVYQDEPELVYNVVEASSTNDSDKGDISIFGDIVEVE